MDTVVLLARSIGQRVGVGPANDHGRIMRQAFHPHIPHLQFHIRAEPFQASKPTPERLAIVTLTPLPGAEPSGRSTLTIDIDVNDGGIVTSTYGLQSWDGGIYDWLDINLVTPTGTIALVSNLGQPSGNYWGSFWQSPNISLSKDLTPWKNQHV